MNLEQKSFIKSGSLAYLFENVDEQKAHIF